MFHSPRCIIIEANAADASIAFSQMVSFISMNVNKTN